MRKMSMRLAALVLPLVVSSVSLAGQGLGDNCTIIVKEGTIKNNNQTIVIKSAPSATVSKVGNCDLGEVRWQDAEVVDRPSPPGGRGAAPKLLPTEKTQVAVIVPGPTGYKEFKVGVTVGSFRDGGKCGPGYELLLAPIIAVP